MTSLDTWRSTLKQNLNVFASLAKDRPTIDKIYSVMGAAVLWGIREKTPDQLTALITACGGEPHYPLLVDAMEGWKKRTAPEALEELDREQRQNAALQVALAALLGYFVQELLAEKALAPSITIEGSVSGANIVIGGQQVVVGDLIIQYLVKQKIRACPTAPKPPAHFAGRRDELEHLKTLLRAKQNTALTGIQGMGGIGKTALAQKLASELPEFSAVLWASVGLAPTPANTLINWAQHADPDFKPDHEERKDPERLAARVQALLTNLLNEECPGPALIVFDDVWEGEGVQAARLLQKAAPVNSVTLITTRSQMVVAQLRSRRVELGYLTPEDALQMLRNLLQAYPDLPEETLLLLAKTVGYHPLALELATGQVTLLERPLQDIDALIQGYQGGIPAGSPFREIQLELGEDREDNLELVLSFSYANLNKIEQAQFRALGVLAYDVPFSRELCEALWEQTPQVSLDALRHRAMLTLAEDAGWYQQHPLIRAYARALLRDHQETVTIFGHYADQIIVIATQFLILPPENWDTNLEPYYLHILYTGDTLVDETRTGITGDIERAQAFAYAITRYLSNRREVQRLAWLEMGLHAACTLQNSAEGEELAHYIERERLFLGQLGNHFNVYGNKPQAIIFYNQALEFAYKLDNQGGQAFALSALGFVWADLGEKRKALDYYEQALPLFQAVGNRGGEANTLNSIGLAWADLGEKRKALDYYEQAQSLSRAVGDRGGEAATLNSIGLAWADLGEKRKALDYYEQSLPLRRAVGDRGGEAATLDNIGLAWADLGEKRKALDYYEQALPLSRAVGDRGGEAAILAHIGSAWSALGEKRKALDYYEQALSLSRAVGDRGGEAPTLNNIGLAWADLGEKRKALNYYEQALSLSRAVGDRGGEAAILNNIGRAWSALGEKRKALDYCEQSLPLSRAVGDRGGEAATLNSIGLAWADLGEKRKALDYYARALPLFHAVGDRGGEAATLSNIGLAWSALGEKRRALDYYEQSLPLRRTVGDRGGEAITLSNIGSAWSALGDERKALDYYEQSLPLSRVVGDRSNEAITCFNIGVIYANQGDLDRAIEYVERCVQLDIEVEHPHLESDRRTLNQLKQMQAHSRRAQPTQTDQSAQVMRQFAHLYQQGGADALRELLKGQASDEAIEAILVQLAQMPPPAAAADTLPQEVIQTWAQNTFAVMTSILDKRAEWRGTLEQYHSDFSQRGADWANEVAFGAALLGILDGKSPVLPVDNPYSTVVAQIIASIQS